jgi:hypothetical protein
VPNIYPPSHLPDIPDFIHLLQQVVEEHKIHGTHGINGINGKARVVHDILTDIESEDPTAPRRIRYHITLDFTLPLETEEDISCARDWLYRYGLMPASTIVEGTLTSQLLVED